MWSRLILERPLRFQNVIFDFLDRNFSNKFNLGISNFVIFLRSLSLKGKVKWFIISGLSSLIFFPLFFYLFIFWATNDISFRETVFISWLILFFILTHEIGHIIGAKLAGVSVKGLYLVPLLGGVADVDKKSGTSRAKDFVFSLGGPLGGLIAPWIFIWFGKNSTVVMASVIVWAYMSIFNLLPVYPMDGGRVMLDCFDKFSINFSRGFGMLCYLAVVIWAISYQFTWQNLFLVIWIVLIYIFILKSGQIDKDDFEGVPMKKCQCSISAIIFCAVFMSYILLVVACLA